MSIAERTYEGSELTLFRDAINWKSYLFDFLAPYMGGDRMLEVGSGLGGNVPHYAHLSPDISLLEPDGDLIAESKRFTSGCGEHLLHVQGTTGSLSADVIRDGFDVILYSDVLEHIEDAVAEVARAAGLLRPGGRLIVVVPAYPALFSEFDAAIGHYRRYTRRMLRSEFEKGFPEGRILALRHLEAVGVFPSLLNKLLLRQSAPTPAQVKMWDTWMVPVSRAFLDPLVRGTFGKSVIGVIEKPAS